MTAGTTRFGEQITTSEARYRAAVRHSSRVRWLRRAIPIGAVVVVLVIAFIAFVEPFRSLPQGMSIGPIAISGTKVTMESPRLSGFKKDNRPYEVNARWAAQDVKNPTVIELKDIRARIALQERGFATVEAINGVYDTKAETIRLRDDVRVKTDAGYDARLVSALVEFKGSGVVSEDPVTVNFAGGTIEAEGVQMFDNGQRVVFKGRVRTTMKPGDGDGAAKGKTTP